MSDCNLAKPLSYAALLVGILYGVQKEMQQGGEITLLLASILIVLLLLTMSFYESFIKCGCSILGSDIAVVLRDMSGALFTTNLFVKEKIIGDMWDYIPLVIMVILGGVYLMQGQSECDRSFMQLYQVANIIAQLYVACKVGNPLVGVAALSLAIANGMCADSPGFLDIPPPVWYNFLAATYCLTANGESIALKS